MNTRGDDGAQLAGAAYTTVWPEEYSILFVVLALLTILCVVAVIATTIFRYQARRMYRTPDHNARVDEGADA
jgi:hypothetical protein